MTTRHVLELRDVTKVFAGHDGPVTAVQDVNFELRGDEFFTMLGPSGCGKTTTLRMIAGLESPTSGRIIFDGRDFTRDAAFGRNIGMVFQSYALFPHMTVFENVAYGLRVRKLEATQIVDKVTAVLDMLGLAGLAGRHPADLSGGQQQRVSIARALVYDPGMLLLDEPLANLDAKLRVDMREEIRRIQKQLGILSIYVTHDQEEAMSVSDRLAVFNRGRLRQIGRPQEVYENPSCLFVADFIGKANFFPAVADGDQVGLPHGVEKIVARTMNAADDEADLIVSGTDGLVMVRPEHVHLSTTTGGMPCAVRRVQFLGSFIRYVAAVPGMTRDVFVEATRAIAGVDEGSTARLDFDGADAILYRRGGA